MNGIPNFGMRRAADLNGVKNNLNANLVKDKNKIAPEAMQQESVNNTLPGTTMRQSVIITRDDDGFHYEYEPDGKADIYLPNGNVVNIEKGTLNGEKATEGEIEHALNVGLGNFD